MYTRGGRYRTTTTTDDDNNYGQTHHYGERARPTCYVYHHHRRHTGSRSISWRQATQLARQRPGRYSIAQVVGNRPLKLDSRGEREPFFLSFPGRASGRGLLHRQELVAMTVHKLVQCPPHHPGRIGRNRSFTVATHPFFHGVHDELLFRDGQKPALFRQPIKLGCAHHHPQSTGGWIRPLRERFRVILSHGIDRIRAALWIHWRRRLQARERIILPKFIGCHQAQPRSSHEKARLYVHFSPSFRTSDNLQSSSNRPVGKRE
jgi:hypothetical protein